MRKQLLTLLTICVLSVISVGSMAESMCLDNTTIQHNITINVGGTITPVVTSETCNYGCDNVTGSCNPSTISSDLFNLILIVGIFAVILIAWRLVK